MAIINLWVMNFAFVHYILYRQVSWLDVIANCTFPVSQWYLQLLNHTVMGSLRFFT